MYFLKPTRWKILLTIIIGSLWFFGMSYSSSFFACGGIGEGLPRLPGQVIPPTPFYELFIQIIKGAIGFLFLPLLWCDESSSEINISLILALLLLIVISYLVSCIIIFLSPKGKTSRRNNSK
jgi:hypothetical protein